MSMISWMYFLYLCFEAVCMYVFAHARARVCVCVCVCVCACVCQSVKMERRLMWYIHTSSVMPGKLIDHLRNDAMQHTGAPFRTIPGSNSMWTFRWIGREGR